MNIVIFCKNGVDYKMVSDTLLLGICDYVNCKTRHGRRVFDIPEKDMRIDIRPATKEKSAGLRPDYALIFSSSPEFKDYWEFNMGGRYTELKTLDEVIQLAIKEEK